ncbi:MAG: LytTR family transcriptional regulator DNA-binding domain-containing protein [Ferruginibacter sp.]|nr:LytTR family transcriptional regulator DNA-binding domain-containing protein [Ferruginibacter sp.]
MPGIKVLLVEDDWIIAKEISCSLQDFGFELLGPYESGEEALANIAAIKPDIVLLDIGLAGDLTGIETAQHIKKAFPVPCIFLTALADMATIDKAKLAEPYAYLVKPVSTETLYSTIEITLHNASLKQPELPAIPPLKEGLTIEDGIFVKSNKRLEKILLKNILWIEAYDIYAMIHTATGKYLLNHSLKIVEEKFPQQKFVRVHRSYIVNTDQIEAIEENDLIIHNTPIPVGKTYRDKLMDRLSFL